MGHSVPGDDSLSRPWRGLASRSFSFACLYESTGDCVMGHADTAIATETYLLGFFWRGFFIPFPSLPLCMIFEAKIRDLFFITS